MIDLKNIQKEIGEWADKNFGDELSGNPNKWRPAYHPLLGIQEEVGELSHAHLKEAQGIRGTKEEHEAEAKDAIGDIIIYIADYCHLRKFDLEDIIDSTWKEVQKRDWKKNPTEGT